MWSLKFLSGPKAGQEILLQEGLFVLGREESCEISIDSKGISKKHAQISIKEEKLFIEDLNSSNGTFVKGKQIKRKDLKSGDKVFLHDIIFEVEKKEALEKVQAFSSLDSISDLNRPSENLITENVVQQKNSFFQNISKSVKFYIKDVLLPGVYQLAEWVEFKFLVACFIFAFVILVTALSSIPLISILKSSVEQESLNNVENIAITLAQANRNSLKKGLSATVNVDYALRRPGVDKAFIISAIDGRILAPAEVAHTYPKDSFIHKARKKEGKTIEKISSSLVAAVVPISFYNPDTGETSPRAYSVVTYNMESLIVGAKKVLSLVIQTFLIAFIISLILYFFLINLIEFPIKSVNYQLEKALKDDKAPSISLNYQSQVLLDLCNHLNSALNQISLNKMIQSQNEGEEVLFVNRQNEMNNLVEVIGFPSMAINIKEETIASLNSNWTDQIGFSEILHQPISEISNSVLREHLMNLIDQGRGQSEEIAFGEISLNQMSLQSTCQFVKDQQELAYAIITFMPAEVEGVA
ncbi:MAG: FHA domain-containing protein [Bdellovibrionaceae bacterium]|nr:FHA domain-containing protein [Pseudobdellovibrionaceae bacterium]